MNSLQLHQEALAKIKDIVAHRVAGYKADFYEQSRQEDGSVTLCGSLYDQGVLDAYEEVQMLIDSVDYELDQILDHHTGIARPLDWQNVGC